MKELFYDVFLSSLRWAIGLCAGSCLGLLGAIITRKKNGSSWIRFVVDFLRAIPVYGFIPFVIRYAGYKEWAKIAMITYAVMFPTWIVVWQSVQTNLENAKLFLFAQNLGKKAFLKHYSFPIYLNAYLKALELTIAVAWLSLVAAEYIGVLDSSFWGGGLGYRMTFSSSTGNWSLCILCLSIFGGLGLLTTWLFKLTVAIVFKKYRKFNPVLKAA